MLCTVIIVGREMRFFWERKKTEQGEKWEMLVTVKVELRLF